MSQSTKSAIWRLVRVFLAGFIGSFSVDQLMTGSVDIVPSLIRAAVIGGISSLFKYLRDELEVMKNLPL